MFQICRSKSDEKVHLSRKNGEALGGFQIDQLAPRLQSSATWSMNREPIDSWSMCEITWSSATYICPYRDERLIRTMDNYSERVLNADLHLRNPGVAALEEQRAVTVGPAGPEF